MKRLILIIALMHLVASIAQGQTYFEGIITYEHTYKSKNPKIDVADLAKKFGSKSEFYFKDGNYRQLFNGTMVKSTLFLSKENTIYMVNAGSDTIFFLECSKPNEILLYSEVFKNMDTILNSSCNMLALKSNNLDGKFFREAYYYFNNQTELNPEWFKNCKYGSYDKIYSLTKSIPFKIVNDRGAVIITMTATSVKEQKLSDELFQLPQNAILSPEIK